VKKTYHGYKTLTILGSVLLLIMLLFFIHNYQGTKLLFHDEAWAAAAANGNMLNSLIFTLRFDLHPPLYYLFVHIWALVDASDPWLLTSSYFTHTLTIILSFYYILIKSNWKYAIGGGVLVMFTPLLFEYSNMLRMYSWLAFLNILLVIVTDRLLCQGSYTKRNIVIYSVVALFITYSHAIGILFVFFHFLFYFISTINFANSKDMFRCVLLNAAIAIASIPAVINTLIRSVSHTQSPDFFSAIKSFIGIYSGQQSLQLMTGLVLAILLHISLINKNVRSMAIAFVILPIIIFGIISFLFKPMWLDKNFSFMVPISICVFVLGVSFAKSNLLKIVGIVSLSFLFVISVTNAFFIKAKPSLAIETSYKEIIEYVNKKSKTNRICVMTTGTMPMFWTILRYTHGPDWGNPLAVQPVPNDNWKNYLSKLPTSVTSSLMLSNQPNYKNSGNIMIAAQYTEKCTHASADSIYIMSGLESFPELDGLGGVLILKTHNFILTEVDQDAAKQFFE